MRTAMTLDGAYLNRAPANEFILGFSELGDRAVREGIARIARRR
jgi:hypothetical protein